MGDIVLTRRQLLKSAGTLAVMPGLQSVAWGAEADALNIGLAAPFTTLDPHLQSNSPNNAVAMHIYDSLVFRDEKLRSKPGLASSWRTLDDTHWEFVLRPGVKFSDGTPFGLEDVQVSIDRATNLPSVASFRTYTRAIKAISAGSKPGTIIVETHEPSPLLPNSLSRIHIISAKFKDAPSSDFDKGRAAIGTGPYLYKEYVPGSLLRLVRNPAYWGTPPAWPEVTLRIMADPGARIANLLSGGVGLIEQIPPEAVRKVETDSKFKVVSDVSSRVVYLGMDTHRDVSPFVRDAAGKPMDRNPFKDLRVRQAVDMAINRQAIVTRVMKNEAEIAAQYLPDGYPGTSPDIKPATYDPRKAKALLAAAGYPNGFRVTLHGPNGRYVNDSKIVQAIAQMLARIGIATTVEVKPWAVYISKASHAEYSFFLASWGVNTGETSNPLSAINATYDPKKGMGSSNWGRYSNPELDKILEAALRQVDDAKRNAMLAKASEIVFKDKAIIPLHFQKSTWAMKKAVAFTARADSYTLAMDAHKA
jgi:peptide/nickel transport system substrate-binding protein